MRRTTGKNSEPIPLARLLDPRPASEAADRPIRESVNIPLIELAGRTAELPPRDEVIRVAGPKAIASETVDWLRERGRHAVQIVKFYYGHEPEFSRLWKPNELLWQFLAWARLNNRIPSSALDLGCGGGRDAVYLAAHGCRVNAVDVLPDCRERGHDLAQRYLESSDLQLIDWEAADVLASGYEPGQRFDLVILFHFFDRQLLERTKAWLNPEGVILVEAFTTIRQELEGRPSSPDRVVRPDELRELLADMDVVNYHEADQRQGHTARIWARKRPD